MVFAAIWPFEVFGTVEMEIKNKPLDDGQAKIESTGKLDDRAVLRAMSLTFLLKRNPSLRSSFL